VLYSAVSSLLIFPSCVGAFTFHYLITESALSLCENPRKGSQQLLAVVPSASATLVELNLKAFLNLKRYVKEEQVQSELSIRQKLAG